MGVSACVSGHSNGLTYVASREGIAQRSAGLDVPLGTSGADGAVITGGRTRPHLRWLRRSLCPRQSWALGPLSQTSDDAEMWNFLDYMTACDVECN